MLWNLVDGEFWAFDGGACMIRQGSPLPGTTDEHFWCSLHYDAVPTLKAVPSEDSGDPCWYHVRFREVLAGADVRRTGLAAPTYVLRNGVLVALVMPCLPISAEECGRDYDGGHLYIYADGSPVVPVSRKEAARLAAWNAMRQAALEAPGKEE
jgi:hypothetical protein